MLDAVSTARAADRGVYLCVWGRERGKHVWKKERASMCGRERERGRS